MGRFLIKQPNGLYCLFSTIVDCPVYHNMTKEDYIEYKMQQAKEAAEELLEQVDNKPEKYNLYENMDGYFHPNNMTREEYKKIKKEMETKNE